MKEGKTNAPRMFCYMEFSSLDHAVLGMALLGNKSGMRISFAKDGVEHAEQVVQDMDQFSDEVS